MESAGQAPAIASAPVARSGAALPPADEHAAERPEDASTSRDGAGTRERTLAPVRARGLVKRYGDLLAVDHVDLEVRASEVYGFLGPNGAGKTTTLRMLLGLIVPSGGSVALFGRDPIREGARALAGVAGFVEAPRFYPYLSGRKNLELLAALDGDGAARRIGQVLDVVDLARAAHKRVGGYSHGMGQRLGIAAALLRDPRLLILDEPATGLDPAGIRDMRELVRRLASEGITVLLSSHQLAEVQEVCDRVAIIRSGRIVYEGPLLEADATTRRDYRLHTTDDGRALTVARAQPALADVTEADGELRFSAAEHDAGALSLALAREGVAILALAPLQASLEDRFFALTEGTTGAAGNMPGATPGDEAPGSAAPGDGAPEHAAPAGVTEHVHADGKTAP